MVTIENLSFAYKNESAIFLNFNWNVAQGERWSIIGPSGCGKTTLLYLLAGLRSPSKGKVIVNNHSNGYQATVGLILQDYGLLPWATAFENATLGLKIHRVEKKMAEHIAHKWLSELGLESVSNHYPAELSGGQRQRVAIARTLALKPSLLMMDEPFASLDTLTREDLLNLVLGLWKNLNSTMLLVTHNIEEAVSWGNKILLLNRTPNTNPIIIENPGSGTSEYRNSTDYWEICKKLRELVESNSSNGKSGN